MNLKKQNNSWQTVLSESIETVAELSSVVAIDTEAVASVIRRYPMRVNPYYLRLIVKHGQALFKQAVPDIREIQDSVGLEDSLNEENLSPVPNLVHKYPDRVLLLVHNQCALYCRFCTRKRKVGQSIMKMSEETLGQGIEYIAQHPAITDVLISGGDPLLLSDRRLESILVRLRRIPHVEIIRIGSRAPCVLPMRITPALVTMLKKYHPLYINTHFNHPAELTPEASQACCLLADAGIPLGCQTVLLKGVNDSFKVLRALMKGLLKIRVKPYYLFQGDLARGTDHFRTPVRTGQEIMRKFVGSVSGLAIPTYAVDLPHGGGKIPLVPGFSKQAGGVLHCLNYCGNAYEYPDAH